MRKNIKQLQGESDYWRVKFINEQKRAEAAEAKMETIAAIAHFGGLADLSAIDALSSIRFATSKDTFSKLAIKTPREVKEFILRKIKENR